MRKLIKKLRCDHEYHEIGKRRSPHSILNYYVVLYCPKCKKEELILQSEYEREKLKRKIDKQFKEEN